jgi:hypothetical protein
MNGKAEVVIFFFLNAWIRHLYTVPYAQHRSVLTNHPLPQNTHCLGPIFRPCFSTRSIAQYHSDLESPRLLWECLNP